MDLIIGYLPLIGGLAVAGLVAGLLAGLLGVGGGIVMVPAMAYAFEFMGYDDGAVMHVAVGTSLAVIIVTGTRSARAHAKRDAVDKKILGLWGPFIVGASLLGGLMAGLYSGATLRIIFGGMALFVALNIVLPVQRRLMAQLGGSKITHRVSAVVVGYVSALMGVGGGALSVPTLVAFGHPIHKAVGTAAGLGVLLAIPGALGFVISGWGAQDLPPLSLGYVNLPALVLIGAISSNVAPFGASLAHKLDQTQLKRVFAVFLVLVGGRMILSAIGV